MINLENATTTKDFFLIMKEAARKIDVLTARVTELNEKIDDLVARGADLEWNAWNFIAAKVADVRADRAEMLENLEGWTGVHAAARQELLDRMKAARAAA